MNIVTVLVLIYGFRVLSVSYLIDVELELFLF